MDIERNARVKLGRNREEAFFLTLKAMLVSPDFLYLKEKKSENERLAPFEIANRLSYFLWSSLPDNELFLTAKENKTENRAILKQQVERLLKDPRSKSFVQGFADSWLRLDKLGTMPPASLKFQEFYRYGLKEAMLEETHRFLAHAIEENIPLTDFIDSEYGFLNQDLARHYGIQGIEGIHFRKVSFPDDSVRGGLLGQASILTLTANGVDTSPVIRGFGFWKACLALLPPLLPPMWNPSTRMSVERRPSKISWKSTVRSKPVRIAMQKSILMDFLSNISIRSVVTDPLTTGPASGKTPRKPPNFSRVNQLTGLPR